MFDKGKLNVIGLHKAKLERCKSETSSNDARRSCALCVTSHWSVQTNPSTVSIAAFCRQANPVAGYHLKSEGTSQTNAVIRSWSFSKHTPQVGSLLASSFFSGPLSCSPNSSFLP